MKILVLSDSHYKKINIDIKQYDYIIHCGDYGSSKMDDFIFVRGNCDFKGKKEKMISINNNLIYITHGDMFNVKYSFQSIFYKAMEVNCKICLFGHTHTQTYFKEDNIIFINPGAYCNNEYCIIDDKKITFYSNDKIVDEFDVMW